MLVWTLVVPGVRAQTTLSGIAGAVKDEGQKPVAGVSVEATSPALIEKAQAAVTDSQGQYTLINLQPGIYTVTFKAAGFATVSHGGIELRGGFTGTLNVDLRAGNPAEVITVTSAIQLVDTRNSAEQKVISNGVDRTALLRSLGVPLSPFSQGTEKLGQSPTFCLQALSRGWNVANPSHV